MTSMTLQPPLPGMEHMRRQVTPEDLMMQVIENGGDPVAIAAVIKELVALDQSRQRFEWEREERRMNIDFNAALTQVQDKVSFVNFDKDGAKAGMRYTTFESLDRALRKHYLEAGFSLSFDSAPDPTPGVIVVVCHLSREAITRDYRIPILVDGSGPKGGGVMTGSQASVAAFSYGCRALLRRIFNVRTGEEDNDGNAVSANPKIVELVGVINAAETLADAKEAYLKAFPLARDENDGGRAMAAVVKTFEGVKKELRK